MWVLHCVELILCSCTESCYNIISQPLLAFSFWTWWWKFIQPVMKALKLKQDCFYRMLSLCIKIWFHFLCPSLDFFFAGTHALQLQGGLDYKCNNCAVFSPLKTSLALNSSVWLISPPSCIFPSWISFCYFLPIYLTSVVSFCGLSLVHRAVSCLQSLVSYLWI